MIRLVREGIGYGVYFAISAGGFGTNEIPSRIGDYMRTVITLEFGDKFKYMDAHRVTRISLFPEAGVRGRGIARIDGSLLEFQTALPIAAEDDFSRGRLISEQCGIMKQCYSGKAAQRIPEIPDEPDRERFESEAGYKEAVEASSDILPFAYRCEDASIYGVDLSRTFCYSVSGRARTGKTNVIKNLIKSAKDRGGRIVIFDNAGGELKRTAETVGAEYVTDDRGIFDFFANIKDEFVRRNRLKRKLIDDGADDAEIYKRMREEIPVYIFISDLSSFVKSVYEPSDGVGEMKGFVENVTERGSLHNIYMFAEVLSDSASQSDVNKVYRSFVGYKTGVHLGGNIGAQRIFNFRNIPYSDNSKPMKRGMGLVPSADDDTVSETIVFPKA